MEHNVYKPKNSDLNKDELSNFREQWQKELNSYINNNINESINQQPVKNDNTTNKINPEEDINETATKLFIKGCELENCGKLYEAIQYYRRAVQLVPDIEFIMHRKMKSKITIEEPVESIEEEEEEIIKEVNTNDSSSDEEEDNENVDLLLRIYKRVSKKATLCLPNGEKNGLHIGQLPIELILYILKWVVSDQLDFRSLEMFSEACRGFYICARDPEIWKMACLRTWGVHCGSTPGEYKSWRNMFIERPRVNFNGCYISRTTYTRIGENSFQEPFYRPWYLVEYFRYLRFYPDGSVLMLTSAEDPAQNVKLLKNKNVRYPVLKGYYRLKDDLLIVVVQRERKHLKNQKEIYTMEFQIKNQRRKLYWVHYSIVAIKSGEETKCDFEISKNRYPPFIFSAVKSYNLTSENPLL